MLAFTKWLIKKKIFIVFLKWPNLTLSTGWNLLDIWQAEKAGCIGCVRETLLNATKHFKEG